MSEKTTQVNRLKLLKKSDIEALQKLEETKELEELEKNGFPYAMRFKEQKKKDTRL